MRDHRHAEYSQRPGPAPGAVPLAGTFVAIALLVVALVAASYPVVALAAVAGALSVSLVRRAVTAVDSFRARRAGDRSQGVGTRRSPRPE